ncbi:MAG: hypothetical protein JWR75_1923 [Devosia sp.]|nr:hypothetical protein [Devosia sp.]
MISQAEAGDAIQRLRFAGSPATLQSRTRQPQGPVLKFVIAIFAALLVLAPIAAAAQQQFQIASDNLIVDDNASTAVFTGNVFVVHPLVTLRAPKVTVAYAPGSNTDIQSFEADGPVQLKMVGQEVRGDHLVFEPGSQMLYVTGNVLVVNAEGKVRGAELAIDLVNNTSVFKGGADGQASGVFGSD